MFTLINRTLAAIVVLGGAALVHADVVGVDSGWSGFQFGGVGSTSGPFTFDAAGPVNLTVADAFLSGDRFSVLDFGVLLGQTSAPTSIGASQPDPDLAVLDPQWSKGIFGLGTGSA